jgi:prolyl-tRNA editing enzyme YbaK/EbsC (Cys-tRNA(Pro) deacylase)
MAKATPASKKILALLSGNNVKFEIAKHRKVYTAYDLAQTMRTKLDEVAKTLLVRVELPGLEKKDAKHYVVVLPASYYVDLGKLKKALGAKKIELVFEKGMAKMGIEPGALTPFGSLRGFGVVVDKGLLKTKKALIGAESFTEHLRMNMKDFVKTENPLVAVIGKKNTMKLQAKAVKVAKKAKVKTKAQIKAILSKIKAKSDAAKKKAVELKKAAAKKATATMKKALVKKPAPKKKRT